MKSRGEWQERLTWLISTTWGRAIPTAIYKYGFIVPGVVLFWRRNQLRNELRAKLQSFKADLEAKAIRGNPDVIAHSFGTWLFGHLCLKELKKPAEERLCFGRVILVGCILRPDFDWQTLKQAGIVSDVLNHFGDGDCVVPLAHYTIWDSGPSGRQGFTGTEVANVRAQGYGHDDLLSMVKKLPPTTERESLGLRQTFMGSALYKVWRPFLELPSEDLAALSTEHGGGMSWRSSVWPLRGTIFPLLIIPALLTPAAWLLMLSFDILAGPRRWLGWAAIGLWVAIAVYAVLVTISMTWNWLQLRSQQDES
ncbi:MAG: hypothetical protein KJZ58_07750 [Flavobacteriales bacterium]|nr:hypothetical protein [Flavobacteriales bacterium]